MFPKFFWLAFGKTVLLVIFKMFFWCLQINQETNKNFVRITALGRIKKVAYESRNEVIQLVLQRALIFWFDFFLEVRAEIPTEISLCFLVNLNTAKGDFEINRHLVIEKKWKFKFSLYFQTYLQNFYGIFREKAYSTSNTPFPIAKFESKPKLVSFDGINKCRSQYY